MAASSTCPRCMAHVSLPMRTAYSSGQVGSSGIHQARWRWNWRCEGITVNGISPGPFHTEMNLPVINDPEANKMFLTKLPVGRWGKVEEIGGLACYLCSDLAGFITGTDICDRRRLDCRLTNGNIAMTTRRDVMLGGAALAAASAAPDFRRRPAEVAPGRGAAKNQISARHRADGAGALLPQAARRCAGRAAAPADRHRHRGLCAFGLGAGGLQMVIPLDTDVKKLRKRAGPSRHVLRRRYPSS